MNQAIKFKLIYVKDPPEVAAVRQDYVSTHGIEALRTWVAGMEALGATIKVDIGDLTNGTITIDNYLPPEAPIDTRHADIPGQGAPANLPN